LICSFHCALRLTPKGINLLFIEGRLYTVISNVSILLAKLMNNGTIGQ